MRSFHRLVWLRNEMVAARGRVIVVCGSGAEDEIYNLARNLDSEVSWTSCRIAGVGGTSTGFTFDTIILDETFDAADDVVWEWYTNEVSPRAAPGVITKLFR